MPIYEFMCQACGNEFERIQSFSDTSAPACPKCDSEEVVRRLGRPAIHFKGSGWYITDSKNGSKQSAVGEGEGSKAAANGTASGDKNGAGEKSVEKSAEKTSASAESSTSSSASTSSE